MANDNNNILITDDSKIVLYQPNESVRLEVKIDTSHDTVWLTQQQIADLFGTKRPAIISVGYRVNSVNATAFRRWATRVLKDYLLKGYSVNQQLLAMQRQIDSRLDEHTLRMARIEDKPLTLMLI